MKRTHTQMKPTHTLLILCALLACGRGKPDVYLDDLKYILDPHSQAGGTAAACFWQPKVGKSYEGQALRVRGKVYAKGLGFRAPSSVRYELKPEY